MFYRKEKKIKELEMKVAGMKDAIDAKYIEKKQLLEDLEKITKEKNEYRNKYMHLQLELETAKAANKELKKESHKCAEEWEKAAFELGKEIQDLKFEKESLKLSLETVKKQKEEMERDSKHLWQIKEKMPAAINMILDAVENMDNMIQDGETPCIVPRGKFE